MPSEIRETFLCSCVSFLDTHALYTSVYCRKLPDLLRRCRGHCKEASMNEVVLQRINDDALMVNKTVTISQGPIDLELDNVSNRH